ncbi:CidA/LrgA family protein [Clostridium botulinum]|uniref:CidA/LrgA family protein n=1 Tax=Clostridium botulinum TaxID=1491 RepID=A0A6B4JJW4_CLOBO|nr:CidA/LrgA family protein [Clostridium botulinum]EES48301.1 LrgA family protein [Clostridium botulinum E1 str. 'BoNT E Beluga']MBY6760230.1 CidA/LrgA family protein [Clostridium botulinum]MBY6919138.1 CidA/LrgA family protein [Clostridium botulinum]MCR1130012.1 CidA/LrgA family protein [Clostridium botulinum]NFJ57220.1 CidA/LrgA family protein [Clostridium botulinum]
MKLFKEALIILIIYLLGEFLSSFFNLPVPGNIIGMIILFLLLCSNVIKVDNISNVSNFLLDHLAFFFIPAGVGLMTSLNIIKSNWLQLLIVCLCTTVIIIASTGLIVQFISKKSKDQKKGSEIIGHNS